ncbi:MAG: hypothetical protein EOO15_04510 [Chitinophagaceae bacterium]|nr:MAG: hypothetical protein EOO15_04510 [Chitinophagaceae bacterium]
MNDFTRELQEGIAAAGAAAGAVRAAMLERYRPVLPYEYQYEGLLLSSAEAAFLQRYTERAPALQQAFLPALLAAAGSAYPHAETEHGAPLTSLLELQCILLPQEGGTEWELDYAVPFDEAVFHVQFAGWDFRGIGLTH